MLQPRQQSRRQFLKTGLATGAGVFLASCTQEPVATPISPTPNASPTPPIISATATPVSSPTPSPPLYLDHTKPLTFRVDDLLSRMTLDEKIGQLDSGAAAIEHLDVPEYNWWNEALHGVGRAGRATVFPQAIGLASMWNRELMQRIATAISDEGRAKHHDAVRNGIFDEYFGLTFWSPNINIFRDPRWGRGQETYGEDPYLTGQIALQFVRGLQGDHPTYLKTVATPKHFAVHSGPEQLRHHFDAQVSQRDLRMTYLPAFKTAIVEGKAFSIMGAYNRTNGEPCCASPTLLQKILREEWGFDGYVVSDCGALYDIYFNHEYVQTAEEAAALALQHGCDLDCCGTYNIPCTFQALHGALADQLITEAEINRAVKRLYMARFKLGMFDPQEQVPWTQLPLDVVDSAENRSLALLSAEQSLILLKNDNLLPLDPTVLSKIALIGPNADETLVLNANYYGEPSDPISVRRGLEEFGSAAEILYARGCDLLDDNRDGFAEAVAAAEQAEVAIMVMGLSQQLEGEQGQTEGNKPGIFSLGDRSSLALMPVQNALIEAIHATGTPIALVLMNGSAVAINWAAEHVPAILEAWYPGQAGGQAIANAIFGKANPAGRLPVTVYRSVADLPPFEDYSMENRTYRYFGGDPLYKFGFGLSYTTFTYGEVVLSSSEISPSQTLTVSAEVRNSGDRSGDEVVQLYLQDEVASLPVPQLQLQGFERITLAPGETKTVQFTISPEQLAFANEAGEWVIEPGRFNIWIGGQQPALDNFFQPENVVSSSFEVV